MVDLFHRRRNFIEAAGLLRIGETTGAAAFSTRHREIPPSAAEIRSVLEARHFAHRRCRGCASRPITDAVALYGGGRPRALGARAVAGRGPEATRAPAMSCSARVRRFLTLVGAIWI